MTELIALMKEVPGYEVIVSRGVSEPVEIVVRNRLRSGTGLQRSYTFQLAEKDSPAVCMNRIKDAIKLMGD